MRLFDGDQDQARRQNFCHFSFASSRKKFNAQLRRFVPDPSKVVQLGAFQLNAECTISIVLSGWPVS
jgi:hypothetical protein